MKASPGRSVRRRVPVVNRARAATWMRHHLFEVDTHSLPVTKVLQPVKLATIRRPPPADGGTWTHTGTPVVTRWELLCVCYSATSHATAGGGAAVQWWQT